jgi:hypothetical protein
MKVGLRMGIHEQTWFPTSPEAVTCEWLAGILSAGAVIESGQPIEDLRLQPIGQGAGMIGSVTRVAYTVTGTGRPGSLVVKSAGTSETNRGVAQTFRLYEREVRFYRELAPALSGMVPDCYFAQIDPDGDYLIVLEDLVGYRCGDQVVGCGPEDARVALTALAHFHSEWWGRGRNEIPGWVPRITDDTYSPALIEAAATCWPTTLERFGHLVPDALRSRIPDFVEALPQMHAWMGSGSQTLAHTDFRLDNLLFGDSHPDRPIVVLDWSSVQICKGMHDVAFLLSQNLTTEHRRATEQDLITFYHDSLVKRGVTGYSREECWQDYRAASMFELMYALVIGGALDVSDPRANAFVSALIDRCANTITDLGLLELIPG